MDSARATVTTLLGVQTKRDVAHAQVSQRVESNFLADENGAFFTDENNDVFEIK